MTEGEEKAFIEGEKAFACRILSEAMRELREDGSERSREAMVLERSQTLAMLRDAIDRVGGDRPEDDLHLSDVIEKSLLRVLYGRIGLVIQLLENDKIHAAERCHVAAAQLTELLP